MYNEIEKGRNNLNKCNKNLICQAFNVNPKWLEFVQCEMFFKSNNDIADILKNKYEISELETKIIRLYFSLPKEDKQNAMALIEFISKNKI